jgi:hypothetical protein
MDSFNTIMHFPLSVCRILISLLSSRDLKAIKFFLVEECHLLGYYAEWFLVVIHFQGFDFLTSIKSSNRSLYPWQREVWTLQIQLYMRGPNCLICNFKIIICCQ